VLSTGRVPRPVFGTLARCLLATEMGVHVLTRDTLGFSANVAGIPSFVMKGYHDVRAERPHDPGPETGWVE